ncbi:IclR family transcriptional regulator C-terminal domain-containing protein [Treponema sp. TIM-1]
MLKQELARVREEYILKDNYNAVPIRNSEGKIIAAMSLTAFET